VDYEILLPAKIRSLTVAEAYTYIEAIQSYPGDWPLVIVSGDLQKLDPKSPLEGLTPIPSTYGALCFPELYVDERRLYSLLRNLLDLRSLNSVVEGLRRGVPLERLVPRRIESTLESRLPEFLAGADFEAFIPLKSELERLKFLAERYPIIEDVEVFRTTAFPLRPEEVRKVLEESYYVADYLRSLEDMSSKASEIQLTILRLEGFVEASTRLKDLEAHLQEIVSEIPSLRRTLMFTRVLLGQ